MSKLKAVPPKEAKISKPKILIFGKPGVGKTWGSLDFPKVFYVDVEAGATRGHYTDKLEASGGVYLGIEQGSTDFNTIVEQVKALATEKHEYKTLIIDSVSKLFALTKQDAAEKLGDDYGRDKKEANKPARRFMSWLQKIDMNVILISHEIPAWGLDARGERTQVGVTFDAWDKLDYDLDLAMNIVKQGNSRIAKITKSRLLEFKEADSFPWSYPEFAKRYGQDVMEKESKPVEIATDEQVSEMNRLIDLLKIEQGEIDKWLRKANVEELKDIDSDKAKAIISNLKGKLQ